MNRLIRLALLMLTVSTLTAGIASATTYYIAANGSDSNNGTATTTPWLHAPGMPNCSATCAAASPNPGDQTIFRGGDTWHWGNSSASPYVSGTWSWGWSGSSGNPIYVGVNQSWYSGSSWVRPVITGDNPASGFVSSCTHDNSSLPFYIQVSNGTTYVTIDNFEFTGSCWSSGGGPQGIYLASTSVQHITIQNNYFHGWSTVDSTTDGIYAVRGSGAGNADYNVFAGNVVDGSDSAFAAGGSSHCHYPGYSSTPCYSGGGIYQAMYDIHGNVFRHLSDAAVTTNTVLYHDNFVTDLRVTYQSEGQHTNCINEDANVAGMNNYFYNNIITKINATECMFLAVPEGQTLYFFNNVMYDDDNYGMDVAPTNCVILNSTNNGSSTAYFVNNTFDYGNGQAGTTGTGGCQISGGAGDLPPITSNWSGTVYFENNHFISYDAVHASPTIANAVTACNTGACTFTDLGGNLFQTEAVANAQGYVPGNNYAPTASSNATVGKGTSLANSCGTFSSDKELCGGTSDGANEQAADGGQTAVFPAIPMIARTSPWDTGAYQFGAAAGAPTPPTGLSAVVQ